MSSRPQALMGALVRPTGQAQLHSSLAGWPNRRVSECVIWIVTASYEWMDSLWLLQAQLVVSHMVAPPLSLSLNLAP